MKNQCFSSECALLLCFPLLLLPLAFAQPVLAAEVVQVDLSVERGPATTIASGFHGGWRDSLPDSLLDPLKPSAVRSSDDITPNADTQNDDDRAASLGAVFIQAAYYPWSSKSKCHHESTLVALYPDMEDQETWDCYMDGVLDVVDLVAGQDGLRDRHPNLEVHYDIWNEPDHPGFFPGADTAFYETWDAAVDTIRALDAEAIITGPSFSNLNLYGPDSGPPHYQSSDRPYMLEFLEYCKENDCLPDVLGWHSIAAFCGVSSPIRNELNLFEDVVRVRSVLDSLGITSIEDFEINEMMTRDPMKNTGQAAECPYSMPEYLQPGSIVRHFSLAEAARDSGLAFACRTYWHETWDSTSADTLAAAWERGLLGGLVDPNPNSSTYLEKRYTWWAHKAYADLVGELVEVDSTGSKDGLAAKDSLGVARILIGSYRPSQSDTLRLLVKGLSEVTGLVVNDVVHVLAQRIPGGDSSMVAGSWVQPLEVINERQLVFGDSLELEVTGFGEYDALGVTLTPIDPDIVPAPGAFLDVQAALDNTKIGNTARVDAPQVGDEYPEDLRIPNGVRVMADSLITIRAVGDTGVAFPENAVPFTAVKNLRFVPSDSTDIMILLRGAGSVRDCVLDGDGRDPQYGIRGENSSGEITGTSVNIENDYSAGIELYDSSTLVRDCWVRCRGSGLSVGIGITEPTSSVVVESTFVSSEYGIYADGASRISYCTVDSADVFGLGGEPGTIVENCVITNWLSGADTSIYSGTVKYCLSEGSIYGGTTVGNRVEDPLICGDGAYTLRIDSYGNPDNNPSGNQIGAFPVACMFDTLARNVSWDGTKGPLSVLGDTTVPSDSTLTLGVGALLEFADDDNQAGGNDPTRSELIINGTLDIDGSVASNVNLKSATDTDDGWLGVRVTGTGSYANVNKAVIQQGNFGIVATLGGSADILDSEISGETAVQVNGSVTITGSTVRGADVGLKVRGGTATISGSEILCESAAGSVALWADISADTVSFVDSCAVGDAETGIFFREGYLDFSNGTVRNCDWGVWVDQDGSMDLGKWRVPGPSHPDMAVTVEDCSVSGITIDTSNECILEQVEVRGGGVSTTDWVGIQVMEGSNTRLTRCVVDSTTGASAIGILVESEADIEGAIASSISPSNFGVGIVIDADSTDIISVGLAPACSSAYGALWKNPKSEDCYQGFSIRGHSRPEIRNSLVHDHEIACVQIGPAAIPDLGLNSGSSNWGNNSIHTLGNPLGVLAGGKSRVSGIPDVKAEKNWWGAATPPDSIAPWVDWSPALSSDPIGTFGSQWALAATPPDIRMLRPGYPMPFSSRVTIPFGVQAQREKVEITVYDVAGRRLRTVLSGSVDRGEHFVEWDGRLSTGSLAPSGVYFLRVQIGQELATQKLVLTR